MFQDSARMVVSMEMPLAKREFSLSCHGSVDTLRLPSLNSFLEVAERIRITSGVADNIRFAMTARNGGSSGTVRPVYHDLKIEMLAKESGRSDGIVQKVGTLLADMFKIKDDNVSYKSGGGKRRSGSIHKEARAIRSSNFSGSRCEAGWALWWGFDDVWRRSAGYAGMANERLKRFVLPLPEDGQSRPHGMFTIRISS